LGDTGFKGTKINRKKREEGSKEGSGKRENPWGQKRTRGGVDCSGGLKKERFQKGEEEAQVKTRLTHPDKRKKKPHVEDGKTDRTSKKTGLKL